MKKVRVVQIGVAHDHAVATFENLCRLTDCFEVIGYAVPEGDSDAHCVGEKAKPIFSEYPRLTVEQALSDPDLEAAVIETSEPKLTEYALLCAQRGLAVHMDKPGGLSSAEYERLISTVKERKQVFHTGYMYRYNPAITDLLERIDRGELGQILYVEAQMNCLHNAAKRKWLEQFPGGMTFFLGCHLVDLVYRIQGRPEQVIPMNTVSGLDGNCSEDQGMVLFRYPTGISMIKTTATEVGGFLRRQLVVVGTKATVELKPLEYRSGTPGEDSLCTDVTFTDDRKWHCTQKKTTVGPFGRYAAMLRDFAEIVRGKENPYSLEYELELYRLLMAACGVEEWK